MFQQIPPSRLLVYLMVLGLIPIGITLFILWNQSKSLDFLQERIESLGMTLLNREQRQSVNLATRETFRNADPFYIDKVLETMTFLHPEIEGLKRLINSSQYTGDDSSKRRLEFLTGNTNKLVFIEGNVIKGPYFQEVTETLAHPVEVNIEDLKHILTNIEGVAIGNWKPPENRPQLLVLDFRLDKKSQNEDNDLFLLNMKLLKREYNP